MRVVAAAVLKNQDWGTFVSPVEIIQTQAL
jgi:hypothetical protein